LHLRAFFDARLQIEASGPDVFFGFSSIRRAIAYGYLQGEGGPVVIGYDEPRADSRVFHCRDVFAFRVIDWRAWYQNVGA
jgi:hypothetical protein